MSANTAALKRFHRTCRYIYFPVRKLSLSFIMDVFSASLKMQQIQSVLKGTTEKIQINNGFYVALFLQIGCYCAILCLVDRM